MTASAASLTIPDKAQKLGTALTWSATIVACAYSAWAGISLYYSTGVFINMFASMGVDMQTPALLFVASYRWSYPLLFGSGMVLVIAKQFSIREKWVSVSITLGTMMVVQIISSAIVKALYQPLFDIIEKLNK